MLAHAEGPGRSTIADTAKARPAATDVRREVPHDVPAMARRARVRPARTPPTTRATRTRTAGSQPARGAAASPPGRLPGWQGVPTAAAMYTSAAPGRPSKQHEVEPSACAIRVFVWKLVQQEQVKRHQERGTPAPMRRADRPALPSAVPTTEGGQGEAGEHLAHAGAREHVRVDQHRHGAEPITPASATIRPDDEIAPMARPMAEPVTPTQTPSRTGIALTAAAAAPAEGRAVVCSQSGNACRWLR